MKQMQVQQQLRALEDPYSATNRKLNDRVMTMCLQPLERTAAPRESTSAGSAPQTGSVARSAGRRPVSAVSVANMYGSVRSATQRFPARTYYSVEMARAAKAKLSRPMSVNVPPGFWDDLMQDFKYYKRPKPKMSLQTDMVPPESLGTHGLEDQLQRSASARPRTGKRVQFTGDESNRAATSRDAGSMDDKTSGGFTLAHRNLIDDFALPARDSRPRSAVSNSSVSSRGSLVPESVACGVISANPNTLIALNGTVKVTRFPATAVDTEEDKVSRIYKNAGVSGEALCVVPDVDPMPAANSGLISRPVSASSNYSRVSYATFPNDSHANLDSARSSFANSQAQTTASSMQEQRSFSRPASVRGVRPPVMRRRPKSPMRQSVEYLSFWKGTERDAAYDN